MKNKLVIGMALGLILMGIVGMASATTITYTDRTIWESATGSIAYTEDFESFVHDTYFTNSTIDVGGNFSLTSVNSPTGRNFIDVSPFLNPTPPSSFGNVAVDMFVDGGNHNEVVMDFYTGISSWFADFLWPGNSSLLTLELFSGSTTQIQVPGTGSTFESFGFISTDDLITSITFTNTINDGFYLDNIAVSSVPEPATMFLFGTGLVGLVGLRRRKKLKAIFHAIPA